jgi:CHAD domain-containing protein
MLETIPPGDTPVTEALLHRYRSLSKRACYAAEFAPESGEAEHFIAAIKRVQDALGDWHDWWTLTQTALRRLGEVHESSLVAELRNLTGAKFRHAVAVLAHSRVNLAAAPEPRAQPPARSTAKAARPVAAAA